MQPSTKWHGRAHSWMRPFAEFAIVAGLCLFALFVVIPAGTVESDNFGLSPAMLPIATVSFILIVSVFSLVFGLVRTPEAIDGDLGSKGMRGVLLLVLATLIGIFIIDKSNIVIGGTALVVLASLAIGERKLVVLTGMGVGALALLLLVEWSGL